MKSTEPNPDQPMSATKTEMSTLPLLPPSSPPVSSRWRSFRRAAKLWLLSLGGYWLALFIATHVPTPEVIVGDILNFDKAIHAGAYFVLATLLFITCRRAGVTTNLTVRLGLVALALAYGAFDELTQPYFGRHCSLLDWYADGVGIALAMGLDLWRHPRK